MGTNTSIEKHTNIYSNIYTFFVRPMWWSHDSSCHSSSTRNSLCNIGAGPRSWGLGGPTFPQKKAAKISQFLTYGTNQDTGRFFYLPVSLEDWSCKKVAGKKKQKTDVFGPSLQVICGNLTCWDSDSDEVSQSWPCLNNHQDRLCLEGARNGDEIWPGKRQVIATSV